MLDRSTTRIEKGSICGPLLLRRREASSLAGPGEMEGSISIEVQ